MNKTIRFLPLLLFFLWTTGCKQEDLPIGLNLQEREFLGNGFSDTITLVAHAELEQDATTTALNARVLGELKDPVFGKTTTDFYTRFGLGGGNVQFGDTAILDSLVLTLQFTGGFYGDTTEIMELNVFELTEDLDPSATYKSRQSLTENPTPLTQVVPHRFLPRPHVSPEASTSEPHLRIRLSNDLGNKILQNDQYLVSDNSFWNFLKGIRISATTNGSTGCLLYVNHNGTISALNLYYHYPNDKESKRYLFPMSGATGYSRFIHDYASSNRENFKIQIDSTRTSKERIIQGATTLYTQPLLGVKTWVNFPHIGNWHQQNIVLNKAELVISNANEQDNPFFPPDGLGLQLKVGSAVEYLPDDAYYTSSAYFGGSYDATTGEYRFRITRYIQDLITKGKAGDGIYIVSTGAGIRGNRLIITGTNPSADLYSKRLRLELYYTSY
jgi:hypothetical protein